MKIQLWEVAVESDVMEVPVIILEERHVYTAL